MARVAVLGTGMAGYGAWHVLRDHTHEVVLYDKNAYPGGHTTSWTFPSQPSDPRPPSIERAVRPHSVGELLFRWDEVLFRSGEMLFRSEVALVGGAELDDTEPEVLVDRDHP